MAATNSFTQLPAEIRNQVYDLVFNDTEILIAIESDGIGGRSYTAAEALHLTCKQVHGEISGFSLPPIDTIVVRPHCEPTSNGGNVVDAVFDLRAWLTARGLRLSPLKQLKVVLHVGAIDVLQLNTNNTWRADLARILGGISKDAVDDFRIDFSISLKIRASSVREWELRLPIPSRAEDTHPTRGFRAVVTGAMRAPKRESGALMPAEWASLSADEVVLLRKDIWNALHTAQEEIRGALFHVYSSEEQERYRAGEEKRQS